MHKITATILLAFFSFSVLAQKLTPKEITKTLCTPEFHGRGYVNGGDSIAAQFLANQFEQHGLKPLNNTSFYQSFSFPVNTFPGAMGLTINGNKCLPGVDFIVEASSGSFTGEIKPFLLTLNTLKSAGALSTLLDDLRQADEKQHALIIDPRGMSKDTLTLIRQLGKELSEKFPVIELTSEKFTWSVSQTTRKMPYILLRDSLWSSEALLSIDIQSEYLPKHNTQNVIGYIPSKRKSNKNYIFITAHYDHLGRMGADTYFPGANDNASGTSILFGLMEKFQAKKPKHNIVFVAFAGEEAGLLGSKYYTEHPIVPLEKIKFLMNLDIMGSGEEGVTIVNGSIFPKEFDRLVRTNEKNQLLKQVKSRGKAANSDHYFFTEKGVTAFFMYTMGPNKHYHDINDQFDALTFAEFEDLQVLVEKFVRKF